MKTIVPVLEGYSVDGGPIFGNRDMETFKVLKVTWKELEEKGFPSVTDYCRYLVQKGEELPSRIEIYRGEMLCMTVTDVKEAAELMPSSQGFTKYKPFPTKKNKINSKAPALAQDAFK